MSKQNSKSWVPIYIALGFVWGCSFIFIKLGLEFLTPFGVAFGRCALGAATLLMVVKIRKIALPKFGIIWLHLWVISLLLNTLPGIFFALAETKVTSILAGIINATTPLMTLIVILIAFREEKPKSHQVYGLLIGALGVTTVLGAWNGIGKNPLWAVLVLLGAVTCYGISYPYSRKFIIPLKLQAESLAATQVSLAAITLLPLYLFDGIAEDNYGTGPVLAMVVLGVFGSGFAYIWNFQIIERAGSAIASSVTYVTPIVAVAVGIIFLGETLSWNEPLGCLIVLFGAALSQGRLSRRTTKA
jgi:drug/metabolite transporter (DMT)-like permease